MSFIIRKFLIVSLLSLLLSESKSQNKIKLQETIKYDKVIKAKDISFFGKFIFNIDKSKKSFSLLYYHDTLQYISVGPRKNIIKNSLFKVDLLSDTLTILTCDFYGRYYATDTLYFFENMCVHKKVHYNFEDAGLKNAIGIKVEFRKYLLINNTMMSFGEDFNPENGSIYNESIKKYLLRENNSATRLKPYGQTSITDIDLEKLSFFRSYFPPW